MSREDLEFVLHECKLSREKINEASERLDVLEHYIRKSIDEDRKVLDALSKFTSQH